MGVSKFVSANGYIPSATLQLRSLGAVEGRACPKCAKGQRSNVFPKKETTTRRPTFPIMNGATKSEIVKQNQILLRAYSNHTSLRSSTPSSTVLHLQPRWLAARQAADAKSATGREITRGGYVRRFVVVGGDEENKSTTEIYVNHRASVNYCVAGESTQISACIV